MPMVTLFGLERSVYTRIARLALEEKRVGYALQEVEIFGPEGVPAEHLARHPFGRIPVLEHEGFWLYETSAICRYIDEAFAGRLLQPTDVRSRARLNQIIGLLDSYAYQPMVWGLFLERVRIPLTGAQPNEDLIRQSVVAARTCFGALANLTVCDPYLLGPTLTLADLHAFPIVQYLSLAPEGRQLLDEHPALAGWRAAMLSRASVQRTKSSYEVSPSGPI
jgi:glutathione S-transferase